MRLPNDTDGIGSFELDSLALELVPNGMAWRRTVDEIPSPCISCQHPFISAEACTLCACQNHKPRYGSDLDGARVTRESKRAIRKMKDRERKRKKPVAD